MNDCKLPNFITQVTPIDARTHAHTHIHIHTRCDRELEEEKKKKKSKLDSKLSNQGDWTAKMMQSVCFVENLPPLVVDSKKLQNQNLVNGVVRLGCENRRLS